MARRRRAAPAGMDLFPFLSIFLCILGVLAFLQSLMAGMASKKVELVGDVSQGYKVAYQVFCFPEGMLLVPPNQQLATLVSGKQPEEVPSELTAVVEQRRERLRHLRGLTHGFEQAIVPVSQDGIRKVLDQLLTVNQAVREIPGAVYEEFLLFGIYPGGSPVYHQFRNLLLGERYDRALAVGLETLDSDWILSLPDERGDG